MTIWSRVRGWLRRRPRPQTPAAGVYVWWPEASGWARELTPDERAYEGLSRDVPRLPWLHRRRHSRRVHTSHP